MRKTETKDEIIQGLMTTINNLNEEISLLREQVAYLTQKLYGKSSGQIKRLDHVQHAYKCKHCSLSNESDKIVKAPGPKAPLAHSYGSASIIAHTLYQKYELKVPAYRQENDWEKLLEQKFLHADETTYRVLESETVKTFYWTFLSDKQAKKQLLYIIKIHIAVVNWPKLP